MDKRQLVNLAYEAAEKSYSPYSGFSVGAALVTEDGSVYTGTNIENSSYGAGICAERTAMVKAVSEGHQSVKEIAIVGYLRSKRDEEDYAQPCGICRQFLSEFATADMKVYLAKSKEDIKEYDFWNEILPNAFSKNSLE